MRKFLARGFLWTYKGLSQFHRQVILVNWGFISECKHRPTCSEYMAQQIEEKGWGGVKNGLKRLMSCH